MVLHTNHAGLVELYYAIPGAPWAWDTWKAITGVHHGLFPDDPELIPAPMTPSGNQAVKTYFEAYRAIHSIEQRHRFASKKTQDAHNEGRQHWRTFVNTNWRRWRIQLKIHQAFAENGVTYFQVLVDNDLSSLPPTIQVSDCFDTVAYELFGDDGLNDRGRCRHQLTKALQILTTNASSNLRKTSQSLMMRTKQQGIVIIKQLQGRTERLLIW